MPAWQGEGKRQDISECDQFHGLIKEPDMEIFYFYLFIFLAEPYGL